MKKLLTAALSLMLLGAAVLPTLAADREPPAETSTAPVIAPVPDARTDSTELAIQVNGQELDVKAEIMVPLRAIAEELGFTVAWNQGVVTVTGSERYIELTAGKDEYFAAPVQEGMLGSSFFSLGCAPYTVDGTTYVPLELFHILLGGTDETVTIQDHTIKIGKDIAQSPNPFTGHDTLAQAAEAAGFELTVPEKVNGNPRHDVQTMGNQMIQVFYGDDGKDVCIRKAPGSEDISGDYTIYTQTRTVAVSGIRVTMKGENDQTCLATWTTNGYTYSISARSGMSSADMIALIQSVK